jgi:hypothetical protein
MTDFTTRDDAQIFYKDARGPFIRSERGDRNG